MKTKRTKQGKPKEMSETDYLLRSPANAKRLIGSIRSLEKGKKLIRPKLPSLLAS